MSKYPTTSYGGVLQGQAHGETRIVQGHVSGGSTLVLAGGPDWEGAERFCVATITSGEPCKNHAIGDGERCYPHQRQHDKVARKDK